MFDLGKTMKIPEPLVFFFNQALLKKTILVDDVFWQHFKLPARSDEEVHILRYFFSTVCHHAMEDWFWVEGFWSKEQGEGVREGSDAHFLRMNRFF